MTQEAKTLLPTYRARVEAGKLSPDEAQLAAAKVLEALYQRLTSLPTVSKRRLLPFAKTAQFLSGGLYLWGDVGRGKSMLMDMFVERIKDKLPTYRVHFHAFMQEVHKRLHDLRTISVEEDLMTTLIREIAHSTHVLCLDEFQVSDVTDAMILSRLFGGLMDAGVTVVFTSNRHPRDLYQGGLQRDQFLKFVDIIEKRLTIHEIKSATDYRLKQLKSIRATYVFPRDSEADDFLLESWNVLTKHAPSSELELHIQGRKLLIEKYHQGIAWLTFGELCVRPLGPNDYLVLAKQIKTLILQGIPALTPENRNEAKRFVTLIDTLYDHRVKLIATAATAPDDIYPKGDGDFEFHRTASRLHEMQSESYLAQPHIA
ncbi:MAG: cell division protein ZapE [Rickettsiales bacterium]